MKRNRYNLTLQVKKHINDIKIMMNKLLILATVLLTSCASITPVAFNGPSGKQAYSMKCSGMGRTLDDCYVKAGQLCQSGYTIVDRSSGSVGVFNGGHGFVAAKESLAIECK